MSHRVPKNIDPLQLNLIFNFFAMAFDFVGNIRVSEVTH